MNSDIRVAVSFRGHRKRKRLRMVLGPGSTDYLIDLWLGTAMNHPDGILHGMDEVDIALEAGWEKDPHKFVDALMSCGFLERSEDGVYFLHDWEDHQGYAVHAEQRKEKARRAAAKRWEKQAPAQTENGQCREDAQSKATSMPQACREDAQSNAPLPAPSPTPAPLAKEEEPPIPPAKPGGSPSTRVGEFYSPSFEEFWAAYPQEGRKGKGKAYEYWQRIGKRKIATVGKIMAAIHAQVQADHFRRDNGVFVPNAATWLNQKRWDDEICTGCGSSPGGETVDQQFERLQREGRLNQ